MPQTEIDPLEALADLDPDRLDNIKQRVSRIRTGMSVWCPFFGHMLLKMAVRILPGENELKIPTMAVTRDFRLFVNADFADKLTDAELAGVLCHEVLRPARLCFERQGARNLMCRDKKTKQRFSLWNVAHDYSINRIILDFKAQSEQGSKFGLPEGGCVDKEDVYVVDGVILSTEEIYDALMDAALKNGDGDSDVVIELQGTGDGSWGLDDMRQDIGKDASEDADAGNGQADGGTTNNAMSEAENKAADQDWKVAVLEAAQVHQQKTKGNLPGGLQKVIEEYQNPKVPWVEFLSRFIGENGPRSTYSYRRPSRRSHHIGEIMPSLQKHGCADVCILWDTSGSMNGLESEILGETVSMCQLMNMSVRIIINDTHIRADIDDVETYEDIAPHVIGGGGSCFLQAFERLEEEAFTGLIIAFTDGYITVPAIPPTHAKGTAWVIWENDTDPTTWSGHGQWGTVIRIHDGYADIG
jgi:predicted metal-dependent peptidase